MISAGKPSKRKLDTRSSDHTEVTDHCSPGVPEKKKPRNADPGVRIQGGRIYCSKTGTTCHQCRQKTVEDKRQCTTCNQQWCPKCLTNRYGPQQEQASREPKWSCPKCLKNCSCSYCRKKAGLAPTGILATTAKSLGFASVAELLEANPDAAKAVQAAKEVKTSQANKPEDAAAGRKKSTPSKAGTKRKNSEACEEVPAVPDQDLPPCLHPMPAAKMLALQKPTGPGASWPKALPRAVALPADCTAGDLLEVIEFVQVFSHHLSCSATPAAALAAELLQDCSSEVQLQEERSSSLLAHLHIQLLSVLCKAQEERIRLTSRNWQQELCQRFLHEAPKLDAASAVGETIGQGLDGCKAQGIAPGAAGQDGQGCKGYWQLAPGVRLRLLKKLCYAVLNTYIFRQHVEGAMEECSTQEKLQREAALERRKQARTDIKRLQEQEIALLIASGQGEGMTLEEQKSKLAAARAKAQGALGKGDCGDLSSGSSMAGREVRGLPLGVDREGACYWKLQAAEAFGGGLLVQSGNLHSSMGKEDWGLHEDTTAVAAALDARGISEGLLRKSIAAAFPSAGTADSVVQLAPTSRDEGVKRAVQTAPKGKRPAIKGKSGKQDTTAAAVAVTAVSPTSSASGASAVHVEGKLCAKDCSRRAAGQCVRNNPARKKIMKKGDQKQALTSPGWDAEAADAANNENNCLVANC